MAEPFPMPGGPLLTSCHLAGAHQGDSVCKTRTSSASTAHGPLAQASSTNTRDGSETGCLTLQTLPQGSREPGPTSRRRQWPQAQVEHFS